MVFVWRYFIDLHNSRSVGGFGINPISYSDIKAYFELQKIDCFDWEVDVIKRLDHLAMKIHAEEAEKESKAKQKKQTKTK